MPRAVRASSSFTLHKNQALHRTTLIREIYRALVNTGRSYAAFTQKEQELVEALKGQREILDPMSGYGLLTRYCSKADIKSYCVEFNLPQYLWQLLCHPAFADSYVEAINFIKNRRHEWPQASVRGLVSDQWFPEESLSILHRLLDLCKRAIQEHFGINEDANKLAMAILLPFTGRLSCSVPGGISTHAKIGGMCVYINWENDFEQYLNAIQLRLEHISNTAKTTKHVLNHGDARTFKFPKGRFGAMVTSPPYPNHRDFASMFSPEHAFIASSGMDISSTTSTGVTHIIGSNFVSNRVKRLPKGQVAKQFLKEVGEIKRDRNAEYDDSIYYIPYFENYFADLEEAYENVSLSCKENFEGYVVVVNNTHRNIVVPVCEAVLETWKELGFKTSIFESYELFHIGTKNPRARGLRARHTEYIIRIWR